MNDTTDWRDAFVAAFYAAVDVEGFDADADAASPLPWSAPWFWGGLREEEYAPTGDAAVCGARWAALHRADIAAAVEAEAEV